MARKPKKEKPIPRDDTLMDVYALMGLLKIDSARRAYSVMQASGVKPVIWPGRRRWWRSEVIAWLSGGREAVRQEVTEQPKQPRKKRQGEPDLSMIGAFGR